MLEMHYSVRAAPGALTVSYLLTYDMASGQKVNLDKTDVSFSEGGGSEESKAG